MANLVIVGLNHTTAELDIRQRMALPHTDIPAVLKKMATFPSFREVAVVSTCNRVEIIASVDNQPEGIAQLLEYFSEKGRISLSELPDKTYSLMDRNAIRHVFRVASALDSMIVGEPQILGQLKSAYSIAVEAGTVGTQLNGLLQAAFRTAKRVRSETSIGECSVSLSSAAVELANKIFSDLHARNVLVVGTGKMGNVAVRHLAASGASTIRVTNRSPEAAQQLAAQFRGSAVPFDQLQYWIAHSDIVLTSTGASEVLVTEQMARRVMHERKNAPIVFIDIAVPRNVDPRVGSIDNVFCYDVDDLGAVVAANRQERQKGAAAAEKIVEQEVDGFLAKLHSMEIAPVVVQLQSRIEEICRMELQRYLRRAGPRGPKETQELESMVSRIAGKIAHPLMMQVRSVQEDPERHAAYLDTIKRIFKLQKDAD